MISLNNRTKINKKKLGSEEELGLVKEKLQAGE